MTLAASLLIAAIQIAAYHFLVHLVCINLQLKRGTFQPQSSEVPHGVPRMSCTLNFSLLSFLINELTIWSFPDQQNTRWTTRRCQHVCSWQQKLRWNWSDIISGSQSRHVKYCNLCCCNCPKIGHRSCALANISVKVPGTWKRSGHKTRTLIMTYSAGTIPKHVERTLYDAWRFCQKKLSSKNAEHCTGLQAFELYRLHCDMLSS